MKNFADCCSQLQKLSEDYLATRSCSEWSIVRFFQAELMGEKIAVSLLDLANKTENSISYPHISFHDSMDFLTHCQILYRTLLNIICAQREKNKPLGRVFKLFCQNFFNTLHEIVKLLVASPLYQDENVNLNYLDSHLALLQVGRNILPDYIILKSESLAVLAAYLKYHPRSAISRLVVPVIETIDEDKLGINRDAPDNKTRFYNLIYFLNSLRMALVDQREDQLLHVVTGVIERALGIVRFDNDERNGIVMEEKIKEYSKRINYRLKGEFNGLKKHDGECKNQGVENKITLTSIKFAQ